MMKADYQMAQQLHAEEQEQLSIEEKSKLLMELMNKRKKHFVEMRAREKRNKPPTQAQQRKLYSFKRVNTFVDYKTELIEESSKRAKAEKESSSKSAGEELETKNLKKQKLDENVEAKVDDDPKEAEMKKHMEIVIDDEKLQENMHAIQVGFKICKEEHLTKVRSLKDDDKVGEQVKCIGFLEETINRFMEESIKKQSSLDEQIRKFREDLDMNLRMIDDATKNLQGKSEKLTQEILTSSIVDEVKTKLRNVMKVKKEPIPFDLPNINQYDESTIPPI
ncbi:hypothetical protein Tco_0793652 [Tanacetum coccineum]